MKQKASVIIFKELSVAKKYLGRESAPLSRLSKLTDNRQTDFLSLNKIIFWLFLKLETFVVFSGCINYSMVCYKIIYLFFKVQL